MRDHRRMDMDDDACYRAIETRDHRFDGRLFVAVKTTGIYCRPFCPAPTPKRENVRFFHSAAAAQEAGFRPCLRCRPETSPDLAFWRGSSNTVSRALGLIEAGALDAANLETLAARLGVGGRQLRRLFRQHLGASPISIAQTRRILLAKQLIYDTRLPMTEVALAAGFGSVRRFNEIFQQLYRRPPGALRRKGVAEAPVGTTDSVAVRLGYRPPYDWSAILAFLRARAIPGIEVVSSDRYARTIAIGGEHGVVVVEPAEGNASRRPFAWQISGACRRSSRAFAVSSISPPIRWRLARISARTRYWRRLSQRDRACGSRCLGRIRTRRARHSRAADHRVRGNAARRQAGLAFGEKLADPAAIDQGLTHVFPTPGRLADADLAALGMPKARPTACRRWRRRSSPIR